jgi:hypothetical protein
MRPSVAIVGFGDLAKRIATALASSPRKLGEIALLGRRVEEGNTWAALLSACGTPTRFICVDAVNAEALRPIFAEQSFDLIVQCASLASPWAISDRADKLSETIKAAGFGLQISAQLPILLSVMEAWKLSGCGCPVVNCSYPDVTHPVLARLGLAPTVGVGNVGMILGLVKDALRADQVLNQIRIFAHHSQVGSVFTGKLDSAQPTHPRVFQGEHELALDQWSQKLKSTNLTKLLNVVTAAHAVAVIFAMLPDGDPLKTAAPGPLGLPGAWPIIIEKGAIHLDLPKAITREEGILFNQKAAIEDGIENVGEDGTIYFTELARSMVAPLSMEIAEPLLPRQALERFGLLSRLMERPGQ